MTTKNCGGCAGELVLDDSARLWCAGCCAYGYTTHFTGAYVCHTCGHLCECAVDECGDGVTNMPNLEFFYTISVLNGEWSLVWGEREYPDGTVYDHAAKEWINPLNDSPNDRVRLIANVDTGNWQVARDAVAKIADLIVLCECGRAPAYDNDVCYECYVAVVDAPTSEGGSTCNCDCGCEVPLSSGHCVDCGDGVHQNNKVSGGSND